MKSPKYADNKNHFHVIYVTGAPATGKSTLVSILQKKISPLKVFSYNKILANYIGKQQSQIFSESEIRKRSAKIIRPVDVESADNLLKKMVQRYRNASHIIIDSHAVTKESYGYRITAFTYPKLAAIKPSMIFVLYTGPEATLQRIKSNSQGRPKISLFEAAFHAHLQASVAITYGLYLGIPIYFMDSSKEALDVANEIICCVKNKPMTNL